jgi:hypothetical protein
MTMRFDIETYKARTTRLRWDELDLGSFAHAPLDEGTLKCIRYMHDIEFHTVCYLRDLLVGSAHADPEVTDFLSIWAYEELWHGEALAAVLAAHGEPSGTSRVAALRRRLGWKDRLRPLGVMVSSAVAGDDLVATHMAWGAVNEWTTQAGYGLLARRAGNEVLSQVLRRIMRQEGQHVDFYAAQAERRLTASPRARRLTRLALRRLWAPVGSKVMPDDETRHLARHLFVGEEGMAVARRIDRRIDALPGLSGLSLLEGSVTALRAA